MSEIEVPDLRGESSPLLLVTASAELPYSTVCAIQGSAEATAVTWVRGDIQVFDEIRVGLQIKLALGDQTPVDGDADVLIPCAIELRSWVLGEAEQPFDRSEGKVGLVVDHLSDSVEPLEFDVLFHAHRSAGNAEPLMKLPLPLPAGSLHGFSEVSGVHLTKRDGDSADAPILFEVDLQKSGNLYFADVQLTFRSAFAPDLMKSSVKRAKEVLELVFKEKVP